MKLESFHASNLAEPVSAQSHPFVVQLDNLVDREANMPVDINSTKSVRHVLFEVLKLEVPNSRRTRTGKVRTDADVKPLT